MRDSLTRDINDLVLHNFGPLTFLNYFFFGFKNMFKASCQVPVSLLIAFDCASLVPIVEYPFLKRHSSDCPEVEQSLSGSLSQGYAVQSEHVKAKGSQLTGSKPLRKAVQLRDKGGNIERLITAVVLEIKFWGLVKAEEAAALHS